MHMYDICCVETICGGIFGDHSLIFSACIFGKVLFTAVIMSFFCV
jgi:hypothetical protein